MLKADKRTLYVGGLDEQVNEGILRAAFIPFGEIVGVQIPVVQLDQKTRGFGFVEFELVEDAAAAIENMNGAELYGRVLKVNLARPNDPHAGQSRKGVWETHTDELNANSAADVAGEEDGKEAEGTGAG
eukprot:RCo006123